MRSITIIFTLLVFTMLLALSCVICTQAADVPPPPRPYGEKELTPDDEREVRRAIYLEQQRQKDAWQDALVRQHRWEWSHRHYDYSNHPWVVAQNNMAQLQGAVIQYSYSRFFNGVNTGYGYGGYGGYGGGYGGYNQYRYPIHTGSWNSGYPTYTGYGRP